MKLEKGKLYKLRNGMAVRVHDIKHGDNYPVKATIVQSNAGNSGVSLGMTMSGQYYGGSQHAYDIVAELTPAGPKLDTSKDVQTKDGRPVTILTTKGRGKYPIVGYVGDNTTLVLWSEEGVCMNACTAGDHADLVNAPKQFVRYINIYEGGSAEMHTSRERADKLAERTSGKRIARKRVEITEGTFDD